jgi:phosphoglycerate dehydrogenase-like enzyme
VLKLVIVVHHRFSLWSIPDWFTSRLQTEFSNLSVVNLDSYDRLPQEVVDADILMTWSLRPEQVAPARKLRWIHSTAAAVHALLIPEVVDSEIVVTNSSDIHGTVVAEHALALMFALAKRLPSAMRHQQNKRWAQEVLWSENPRPRELNGATLVVVGLGAIGREVARIASALGMHVIAVRENPQKGSATASEVKGFENLNDVLPLADFVVLAAPLTPETKGCFNAERFACLKPDSYFINVARGALVDEPALIDALRSNTIGGAALDVFSAEPLSPDSPLWTLENVLMTPHSAALTEKQWDRHYAFFSENLRRFKSGEALLGIVDKKKGY